MGNCSFVSLSHETFKTSLVTFGYACAVLQEDDETREPCNLPRPVLASPFPVGIHQCFQILDCEQ